MTLAEYAAQLGATVRGDGSLHIDRISAIDEADERTLTYATDVRYLRAALASRAAAIVTEPAVAEHAPDGGKPLLVVASARAALATLLALLARPAPRGPYRHPSAAVDPSATIGPDVFLGPHVSIGAGATVGARSVLLAGAHVGDDARVGEDCFLHPRATLLDRCVVGDRVILHAGCVIGSDGFGYAFADGAVQKIPQVGNVVLGSDVEIGANTCIDRAQTGATIVGEGTKIDNLVQIGHNCRIGKHGAFAALSGLAGSTIIGDYVKVGGACGFAGHLTVGSHVTIGGHSMIYKDVPDGAQISGIPAQDHREELRQQVRLRKLPKLYDRVTALEQK